MTDTRPTSLQGTLFLVNDEQQAFAAAQVSLLAAIAECGSISKAAKRLGISYKTAWDRVDAMNNMSEAPLVVRSTGGAKGGGTRLTPLGEQIVQGFQTLEQEHQAFVERLGQRVASVSDLARFMRSGSMKTSARNQFRGQISAITPGAVNTEVELQISDAQTLIAQITNESAQAMGLDVGGWAVALVKASWVLISKDTEVKTSARNHLTGSISRIERGAVNADITLDLGQGKSICAIITNTSVDELELAEGDQACALCKASSVILMVE